VASKTERFSLLELPDYAYPLNRACPSCYRPLDSIKRRDARCDKCLHDKKVLPVNYLREKKRDDEEDEIRDPRYED